MQPSSAPFTHPSFFAFYVRDLTIWQQWRQCKRLKNWLTVLSNSFAIIQTRSVLKVGKLSLELKREDRVRTQKDTVRSIPFTFERELKIWSFVVVVVQGRQQNWQKSVMRDAYTELLLLFVCFYFWRSCCCCRRSFVTSLTNKIISWERVCYQFCVHELKRSFRENKKCLNGSLLASFNQRIQRNSNFDFHTSHGAGCYPPHLKKILLIKCFP